MAIEFLSNPKGDFIIKEGFLFFKGRIYVPSGLRKELL
jgi:hypothetical protein